MLGNTYIVTIVKKWLNRSFPLATKIRDKAFLSFILSVIVFMFLKIAKAASYTEIINTSSGIITGLIFSLSTGLATFIGLVLFPLLFKRYYIPSGWTIGKNIVHSIGIIMLVLIVNFLLHNFFVADLYSLKKFTFLNWSYRFIILSLFPIIMINYFLEVYLRTRNESFSKRAKEVIDQKRDLIQDEVEFVIRPETKGIAEVKLTSFNFLFAKSLGNYTQLYYMNGTHLEKTLIRLSLKKLSEQLNEDNLFIRCHRFFIVNKSKIIDVKGNSRAINLILEGFNEKIPVSRKFISREFFMNQL